jgi:hypothetical protein
MGRRPSPEHLIARIDDEGDYSDAQEAMRQPTRPANVGSKRGSTHRATANPRTLQPRSHGLGRDQGWVWATVSSKVERKCRFCFDNGAIVRFRYRDCKISLL